MLEVRVGDQVVADGVLVEAAGLEVDESLLSGETLAVSKAAGDEVWSGSVVVAGRGTMQVSRNTHKLSSDDSDGLHRGPGGLGPVLVVGALHRVAAHLALHDPWR